MFLKLPVVLALTGLLTGAALAQSTDPSRPSPWTSYGINGHGIGRPVTYYYSVPTSPGLMTGHLRIQGAGARTQMSVTYSQAGAVLGGTVGGGEAWSAGDSQGRFRVARGNVLMAIQLDANAGNYSVWLDRPQAGRVAIPRPEDGVNPDVLRTAAAVPSTPAPMPIPFTTWEMSGRGEEGPRDFYFPARVGTGDLTIQVTCQARTWSTAVALDVEDPSGTSLRRVGAIATTTPATDRGVWHSDAVRDVRIHVHVESNCDTYSWSIQGPLEH